MLQFQFVLQQSVVQLARDARDTSQERVPTLLETHRLCRRKGKIRQKLLLSLPHIISICQVAHLQAILNHFVHPARKCWTFLQHLDLPVLSQLNGVIPFLRSLNLFDIVRLIVCEGSYNELVDCGDDAPLLCPFHLRQIFLKSTFLLLSNILDDVPLVELKDTEFLLGIGFNLTIIFSDKLTIFEL